MNPDVTSPGVHLVQLAGDHPGFKDLEYRKRRDTIARLSMAWRPGMPVPDVPYTDDEHRVWRQILAALQPLHQAKAGRAYHEACELVRLRTDQIPQLSEVNSLLTSYRMVPAGGLVNARDFLLHLGAKEFESTQYIRHQSRPFYTPEPDVVHELVGHAASLAHPLFTRLNELFGLAIATVDESDEENIATLIRLYWWTVEFGVHREDGRIKTCGAGLLSSIGELGEFDSRAKLRAFSVDECIATAFDPTAYQGTLFVGESFEKVVEETAKWLEGYINDRQRRTA